MLAYFISSTLFLVILSKSFAQTLTDFNATVTNATYPTRNTTTVDIRIAQNPIYTNESISNLTLPLITQRVSYFVDDGLAIIDGDVIFGTVERIEEAQEAAAAFAATGIDKRAISIFTNDNKAKWPGGVIKYKWESQASKDARLEDWTEAMKRWTDRLPFLTFIEAEKPNKVQKYLGPITLRSSSGTGSCSSPLGRAVDGPSNVMKLDNCGPGGYAHEIGHSLGLWHEQMRLDRDAYLTLDCSQVMDEVIESTGKLIPAVCEPASKCQGHGCQFRQLAAADFSSAGPYDIYSLMHYSSYAFAKGSKPTLIGKPPIVLRAGGGSYPTVTDARRICDIYHENCRGICGDGILSPNNFEECDDGNNDDGDGCSANCKKEAAPPKATCGDGTVSSAEECDDGNTIDGDGCSANCKIEFCGDGVLQASLGEQCDHGNGLGGAGSNTCDSNCKAATTSNPECSTCSPNAGENICHPTTTCMTIQGSSQGAAGGNTHYCACAHGFRAQGVLADDVSSQFRLPWWNQNGRVFVKPGLACNQLCDGWALGADGCKEVKEQAVCY